MRKWLNTGFGLRYLFPIAGLISLIWFCVRVIPKPSRAAYPCQRAAAPMASAFVLWLIGIFVSIKTMSRARRYFRAGSCVVGAVCIMIAVATIWTMVSFTNSKETLAATHSVFGTGKGIYPGRVVWVRDPNATDWGGTDDKGRDIGFGYWWQSNHTNQTFVNGMMSQAIRALSENSTDSAAWDAIFRSFNQGKGKGNIGYTAGEKIMIKPNMVTCNRSKNNVDANGNQTSYLGWVNTSPQMLVALLRQLVNVVGVAQSDITVGDTTCYFPNHYWNICHAQFPDVHYIAWSGTLGRLGAVSSQGYACETPVYWSDPDPNKTAGKTQDYLPVSYAEAAYLINFACLKGHSAGVSICGKNHYGSFIRLPDEAPYTYYNLHLSLPNLRYRPGMGYYRAHVDIMGNPNIGGRTLLYLIDGLYGGYYWEGQPYKWQMSPFYNDWPSSLFASQDPVAIDSVAYDFLLKEWPRVVTGGTGNMGDLQGGAEDYLHEAALADNPPSGTFYDPNHDGTWLSSLGTHEHWNNDIDKKYSRDLGGTEGIELVSIKVEHVKADLDIDLDVDFKDFAMFGSYWLSSCGSANSWCGGADFDENGIVNTKDLLVFSDYWLFGF